jgi:hypothetical protein
MRSLCLAILPLLVAASLAAQTPPASSANATPVAVLSPRRTAFFDVAALVDNRQRFGLEPLVFGRWTVGLVGAHTRTTTSTQVIAYGNPLADPIPTTLCPVQGCPPQYPGSDAKYNAWSLDLAVRYYPAAWSFSNPRQRMMVYVGEFIGYHQRTVDQPIYAYPLMGVPATPARTSLDSVIPNPPVPYPLPNPQPVRSRLTGWEPGAEIGVRLMPLEPVFIDVGGWFKLVTIDDPMQRVRPGQLDSRLVVAVGVGW